MLNYKQLVLFISPVSVLHCKVEYIVCFWNCKVLLFISKINDTEYVNDGRNKLLKKDQSQLILINWPPLDDVYGNRKNC